MGSSSGRSPYLGLVPYSEADAPYFFGREAEREIITANLMASRMTLLYGASGVGKSSILYAGVVHDLRELARQNRSEYGSPELAVVAFSSWRRPNPLNRLITRVEESVALALGVGEVEPMGHTTSLGDTLNAWADKVGGDLLIILDQFEEYFLYHPHEDGEGTFAFELSRAVDRHDVRASFLISIREDSGRTRSFQRGSYPDCSTTAYGSVTSIEKRQRPP